MDFYKKEESGCYPYQLFDECFKEYNKKYGKLPNLQKDFTIQHLIGILKSMEENSEYTLLELLEAETQDEFWSEGLNKEIVRTLKLNK
jgi:hypothetical protein